MLGILSFRNAKRQLRDYLLYLVTLVCTVSFMYAFNALIFTEHVKVLRELELLPYLVIAVSLLIIFVLGWVVTYMTNYMLKRRSKELSIYMVSGITNQAISKLIFLENMMIGGSAFLLSLPVGVLLSQILEAVLLHVFERTYSLSLRLSFGAVGLTFLYFTGVFLYALLKNRAWICKIKLYDLLCYERENEKKLLGSKASTSRRFLMSILMGSVGIFIMLMQPWGKGFDILIGMVLLLLCVFGFFQSVSAFLAARFENQSVWKYTKDHLIIFRAFTSKIRSMSVVMGVLSILFLLAMILFGVGISTGMIVNQSIKLNTFDIIILHNGEMQDFSGYDVVLQQNASVRTSYAYSIYTDTKQDLRSVRERAVEATGRMSHFSYQEFLYDTYMKQSDYAHLRKMLGYEEVELKNDSYYIHCVPILHHEFTDEIARKTEYELAGYTLSAGSVCSEPFTQNEPYGNGLDFVMIIPDAVADQLQVLYSLYTVLTEVPLNSAALFCITESCEELVLLDKSVVRGSGGRKEGTALIDSGVDYLSGRWAQKENLSHLYALLICMFYLALILEITGAVILATQVLSEKEKKLRQDKILWQLGMSKAHIGKLNYRQLSLLFWFPILPALLISSIFTYAASKGIQHSMFNLPIFTNDLWIWKALGMSLVFFALLYGIYFTVAWMSYGEKQWN